MPTVMNRHAGQRASLRAALSTFALALVFPAAAHGQTTPDSTAMPVARADSAVVSLTPTRPTQGSVVRITLRLPSVRADSDAVRAVGAANVIPPDSIGSAVRGVASVAIDSLRPDSSRLAAQKPDAITTGTLTRDSLGTVVRFDSLGRDSLRLDSPGAGLPRSDSVKTDSLRGASSRADALPADSLRGKIIAIHGTLFGEPLHFLPDDSGAWSAIGGVPVDAPRSVRLPLIVERVGVAPDTIIAMLEVGRTAYRMEKLTVAPKFGQAPDSALSRRIAREQALAAAVSRQSHETPRLWTGDFARPREARVTSRFGDGREFNGTVQSRHMGLDLAGAVGAPVLAPDRGVVALVGDFYYAGNAVYIDHGAGLVTAYFHLSKVNVARGDTVAAGDTIGQVGATGRVTGPHLHWVARYGAITVDPSTLLELGPARHEP